VPFARLSRLIGAGTVYSKGCFFRRFFHGEELTISEPRTPAEGAPPAETVKEHVKQTGEDKNLGAGGEEPDPATADAPRATSGRETKNERRPEQDRDVRSLASGTLPTAP
jgi:hypothetical protein